MSSSPLARIVKGFGDHHLGKCCRRPVFRQSRAGHADVEPGAQFDETGTTAFGTGAGFIEMCTIFLDGVAKATTITGDTRHDRIEGIKIFTVVAVVITFAGPSGVRMITISQFSADPADFTGRAGGLDITQVTEEIHVTFEPFGDPKVRQAIAHGINIDEIIKYVMEGSAYPASQIISQYAPGFNPNIKRAAYDPKLAKKLLAEAGYPNGFEANFDCPNDRYINDQQVTEAIAHQLGKIGLKLKVVATPKAVFFPKMNRHESPMFLAGWGTFSWQGTMNGFFRKKKGSVGRNNRGRFYDPEIEKRIVEAASQMDPKKSNELKYAVAEDIYKTCFVIPLYYQENVIGLNKRVIGKSRTDERIFAFMMKKAG